MGPPIGLRLPAITDPDLAELIHDGRPLRGMPGNVMPAPEMAGLQKFLRAIQQDAPPVVRRTVQTTDGRTLEGELLGEGASDLQLRTADKRVQLLRREGDRFRPVTSETDWPTYNGEPGRQPLHDADADRQDERRAPGARSGCSRFPTPASCRTTPVVAGGIMYVTAPNECFALDAGTRPADLALQAAAHQGRLRRQRQPRRRASPAIASSWSPITRT